MAEPGIFLSWVCVCLCVQDLVHLGKHNLPKVEETCIGLARLDELLQEVLRGLATRAIVLRHAYQGLLLPHPVLQHLGRRLHKVSLHVGPTEHSKLCLEQAQAGKVLGMLAQASVRSQLLCRQHMSAPWLLLNTRCQQLRQETVLAPRVHAPASHLLRLIQPQLCSSLPPVQSVSPKSSWHASVGEMGGKRQVNG